MRKWQATIKLKDLLTENEDYESVQNAMNAIADKLEASSVFIEDPDFFEEMRNIPEDDALDAANELMNEIYDICDERRIWVE